jgi:hypothetical protein
MATSEDRFLEDDLRRRFDQIFKAVTPGSDLEQMLRQLYGTAIAMAKQIQEQKQEIARLRQ